MSLLTILTAIFVTLKLTGHIEWSWWLVLSPTILQVVVWVIMFGFVLWAEAKTTSIRLPRRR